MCFFYRIIAQIFRNTYVSTSAGSFLIRHHAAVEKQFLVCFEACRSRCRRDPLSDKCNVFYFFVGYLPEEIRRQMIITVSLDRLSVDASFLDHHPLFFGEPQILLFIRVAACKQIIVRYPQVVRVNDRVSLYALASIGCIRILA